MSAQIMNPDRPKYESIGKESEIDLRKLYNGYISYFGKFSLSESGKTVIHHVEGSLQTWILGTDQERQLKLEGNKLTLSAELTSGLKKRLHEIIWEKF
jgi:Lipocalin-like domain